MWPGLIGLQQNVLQRTYVSHKCSKFNVPGVLDGSSFPFLLVLVTTEIKTLSKETVTLSTAFSNFLCYVRHAIVGLGATGTNQSKT